MCVFFFFFNDPATTEIYPLSPPDARPISDDVAALVLEGSAAPDARVVLLARERIEVLLPDAFPSGSAEAILFTIHEGETILSNPVSFEIEAAAP